jgi:competence protein ComGC
MKPSIHSKPLDRTSGVPEKHERAFTLVDLSVVIVTLTILAALILLALFQFTNQLPGCGKIFKEFLKESSHFLRVKL